MQKSASVVSVLIFQMVASPMCFAGGGATRNLTSKFNKLRANPTYASSIQIENDVPHYVTESEDLDLRLDELEKQLVPLHEAYDEFLKVSFDNKDVERQQKISAIYVNISREMISIGRKIDSLQPSENSSGAEYDVLKSIRIKHFQRLQNFSFQFLAKKAKFEELAKKSASYWPEVQNTNEFNESFDQSGLLQSAQIQSDEESIELARAKERERAIIQISESVQKLALLFQQLNTTLIEQGTVLDRIDHNVEKAKDHVTQGTVQVVKAEKYQRKASNLLNKTIGVLTGAVAVLGTVLGIKLSH